MKIVDVDQSLFDFTKLSSVPLTPAFQSRLQAALASNGGDPAWRSRKKAEAKDLLALEQVAPRRLTVFDFDLQGPLRVVFALRAPVPCLTDPRQELMVMPEAVLGLNYSPESARQPTKGHEFVTILAPRPVWYANVALPEQPLCLGATLPAGIRVRSLVLMTYLALTGQTTQQVDPGDGAGILNYGAAIWWQKNLHRLPLSREPFLSPVPSQLGGPTR